MPFDGGVFWVGSGGETEARSPVSYQKQLHAQLQSEDVNQSDFATWQQGLIALQRLAGSRLAYKRCLIVVDNPPTEDDPLKALEIHENAVFLVTTPDVSLLNAKGVKRSAIFKLEGLHEEEAIRLLSKWTEIDEQELPDAAREIARRVDYLPLAIAMIGAVLKGATDPKSAWADVLDAIKEGDLSDISHAVDKYPLGTLTSVFKLALSQLEDAHKDRFYELAIFPQGWRFELSKFFEMWNEEKERKIRIFVQNLVNKALLQQVSPTSYSLHSLIRLHIRNEVSDLFPIYQRIAPLLFSKVPLPVLATFWQDKEALKYMANRINVDEEMPNGLTALHLAAERGYEEVVNLLLDAGASIDKKDLTGVTALMRGAINGHANILTNLLRRGSGADLQEQEGFTALHCAAQYGHIAAAHSLLLGGATANLTNNHHKSPLHIAAIYGHAEIVEALLQRLPLREHETDPRQTPLRSAAIKGHLTVARILIEAGAETGWASPDDGSTALHVAAQQGHTDMVELLIKSHAEINSKMKGDFTPLHLAAQGGHTQIVKMLVAAGSDVNACTDRGHTPLHSAVQERHSENRNQEIAQTLIQAHADVNAQNDSLFTPLHLAALTLDVETARLLISAGSNVNATQDGGYTALALALIQRDKLVVSAAYQRSAFSMTEEGTSVQVSTAIKVESGLALIKLLLENGASVNLKSNSGMYPLHFAAAYGDPDCVKLLLGSGASSEVTNTEGETPLDLAIRGSKTIHSSLVTRDYAGVIELLPPAK